MFEKPDPSLLQYLENAMYGAGGMLKFMDVQRGKWSALKNYVRPLIVQRLDQDRPFDKQDKKEVEKIIQKTVNHIPYLKKYEGHWPVETYMRRYFNNRQHKLFKRQVKPKGTRQPSRRYSVSRGLSEERRRTERNSAADLSTTPNSYLRPRRRSSAEETSRTSRESRVTRSQSSASMSSSTTTLVSSLSPLPRTTSMPKSSSIYSILRSCNIDLERLAPIMEELGIFTIEHARVLSSMPEQEIKAFFDKHHEKLNMNELQRFIFVSKCKSLE